MTARPAADRHDSGHALPLLERLAPGPPEPLLLDRIDTHTKPGDLVVDLAGRGGWVARAALDRHRPAVSLETSPLSRLLAEIILRPPDVRHLDAAFQGMAASPRGDSSLKVSLGDSYATRCATCGRRLVAESITWAAAAGGAAAPEPVGRRYRCTVCRDQRGGTDRQDVALDDDDRRLATASLDVAAARTAAMDRFPAVAGAPDLVGEIVDLHTPRQLVGLVAIIGQIEADLRAAPLMAALRLAFMHAVLPASRLATASGRQPAIRIRSGHVRLPPVDAWRERNPWLAFEESFRLVRGFVQALDGGALGPLPARLGEDIRALGEGAATLVLALAGPSGERVLHDPRPAYERVAPVTRIKLVLGQPSVRPSTERLALAYHGTAWALGCEATLLLPIEGLADAARRAPWAWQATALRQSLSAVVPAMARDSRVVQLTERGPEALAAAVMGGVSAGCRLVLARLGDGDGPGIVELVPPGSALPSGARTRANVGLPPTGGGSGDPEYVPSPRLFAPPERIDDRPFSAVEASRAVTDIAVQALLDRGEPASFDRLLGEVLVGLDRAGHLRRLVRDGDAASGPTADRQAGEQAGEPAADDAATTIQRLLDLVHDDFEGAPQRRLLDVGDGQWWLADRADRDAAAVPLSDRVEWAVFSLLSTSGPLSEATFRERIGSLFSGPDQPDAALVQACLDSYRGAVSTPHRLVTDDDLSARSDIHTALLAEIADGGHRAGMRVWLARREQGRHHGAGRLGDLLDARERDGYGGGIGRPVDDLNDVDAVWYVRGKVAFAFEVEWTAMLGETVLRRHARIGDDERLVRFLVIAPQRASLLRHKLDGSPLLRTALEEGGWHILKWDHLRTFLAQPVPDLASLEPLLGLDPVVDRRGEQLPLFGG